MKVEVRHPKFFEIFEKYDGYNKQSIKLKRPKQLQEILDISRYLLNEIQLNPGLDKPKELCELEEKQAKLEQLRAVLEMYGMYGLYIFETIVTSRCVAQHYFCFPGHFSGINRKVQMKYQPNGKPKSSSSDEESRNDPSLVLILKWGGELTPAGRVQAEELGRMFRYLIF